ncbi:MAG: S41 family peptidase [Solirubrobacterales bacterium]
MNPSRTFVFILGALIGIVGGLLLASNDVITVNGEELSLSDEAIEVIGGSYFREPDLRKLGDASVNGIVDELRKRYDDRFSHYFDPETLEDFNAQTSGQFTGVGLAVVEVKQGLRVAAVYPDTPAKQAGIKPGDVISAVDGEPLADLSAEAAAAQIKGEPGTKVTLEVSTGKEMPRPVEVERAAVRIPAVRGEIKRVGADKRAIAYVQLATFSEGAHAELREEIERLYRRGAEGLVLDLRGNGGGLLNEGVLTSSVFVEDGLIVATEGRTQRRREYDAVGDAIEPRPAAVLVNGDTASASEILTAALADYDLAEIVGTTTFGKGTVQEVIELENGGALDLTVGEYLTSEDVSLAGSGIKPDVKIEDEPKTAPDEALDEALAIVNGEL